MHHALEPSREGKAVGGRKENKEEGLTDLPRRAQPRRERLQCKGSVDAFNKNPLLSFLELLLVAAHVWSGCHDGAANPQRAG